MSDKTENLAKKFIVIPSVNSNPEALDKVLEAALSELQGFTIERFESHSSKSALIYTTPTRPQKFKVILNGHLDVIPGKENQYHPTVKGNRLYGVGAADMKASVACLIRVFKETAHQLNFPLGLQLVTDEENGGHDGTKYQISQGVRTEFVIAGEKTNFNIACAAKGVLWLKISCFGKTAHGAYPWAGKNAIWKMNRFLNTLDKKIPNPHREMWKTTVNLSRIETPNQAFNKIPDACHIYLDIRYIPKDADTILKTIKKILPEGFKVEIVMSEPALSTAKNHKYLKLLRKSAHEVLSQKIALYKAQGSSDARHFSAVNNPGVEFGPVGGGSGTDTEWIDIKSLDQYCQILKTFLLSINSNK
jgi:succinyl-diaminopimelate desuccinylase